MTSHRQSARAFTAVELLAATALASVLMLAVLAAIASIDRTRATVARHQGANPWLSRIEPLIRQDLCDAKSVDLKEGRISLKGYAAIDPVTLARTHQPAEISYLVRKAGGTSVLLRQQKTFDPRTGVQIFTELVALDVAAVSLKDLHEHQRVHLIVTPSIPSGPSVDQVLILQ